MAHCLDGARRARKNTFSACRRESLSAARSAPANYVQSRPTLSLFAMTLINSESKYFSIVIASGHIARIHDAASLTHDPGDIVIAVVGNYHDTISST